MNQRILNRVAIVLAGFYILWLLLVIRGDYFLVRTQLTRWPVFSSIIKDRELTKLRAKAMALSFSQPSFEHLVRFLRIKEALTEDLWQEYMDYYAKVVRDFPRIAEAYGMLGFCSFHLGKMDVAIFYYQQATRLNPQFFWYLYNLGVLYYKNFNEKEARESFLKAFNTDAELNLKLIYSSRLYQQIFWPEKNFGGYSVEKNLQAGYQTCEQLIKILNQPGKPQIKGDFLEPKIF